jgi:folate-dependent phosphoribosylglycinamide formyltransferase PurN
VNPALVVSSRRDAGGILKAKEEGLADKDIVVLVRKEFENSEAFGEAILRECCLREVDLIGQCGFLPRMPSNVIAKYELKIFNQHPGPLDGARPGFGGDGMYGKRVHHAVLCFAARVGRPFRTEATVHRVIDKVDGGALLGVQPVEILAGDDASTLAERVLPHEHALVIRTILAFSEFGGPHEIHHERPLIHAGEENLLEEAKKAGIANFPKG